MTENTENAIYTIGYAGLSIDEFVAELQRHDIELLVDIRDNPYSRKRDFSARALADHLAGAGIRYLHLKQLGCPASIRKALKQSGDFEAYRGAYLRHLDTQIDTLNQLYNLMYSNKICLMCLEQDATHCHRLLVTAKLTDMFYEDKQNQLEIIHLK